MTSTASDPVRPRRRGAVLAGLGALLALVVIAAVVVVLTGSGLGAASAPDAAAALVPSDALAYVNLELGRGRPAVSRGLRVAGRLPDFPLLEGQGLARLSQVITGGHVVDTATDISPWLGDEAAVALLDTGTSTANSLVVLRLRDAAHALRFIQGEGARPVATDRGHRLLAYPDGSRLAITGGWLLIGQDASVRAALDVQAGASSSLAASPVYGRAVAGAPDGRVLNAYASVDGVRRVLAPQSGLLGALGQLLDQPALQGVAVSVVPTRTGAHVRIHSALDASLTSVGSSPGSGAAFSPTLQALLPSDASLLLDVTGLDRLAPRVLNAGSAAGVAGGLGPLLSRLGAALRSEGVNTADLVSLFHRESAVAIVPSGSSQALVVLARAPDAQKVATELAELQVPLARLFAPTSGSGAGSIPTFNERTIDGVTAHQLALSTGLELDYALFRGLLVISTSLNGIGAVAHPAGGTLSASPAFATVLRTHPSSVTSLVYADLGPLLGLGRSSGLTGSGTLSKLGPDLARLGATGLTSTRTRGSSTTELELEVH